MDCGCGKDAPDSICHATAEVLAVGYVGRCCGWSSTQPWSNPPKEGCCEPIARLGYECELV
jgi:hypothetical protein